MGDWILTLTLLALAALGWRVMGQLDDFLEQNEARAARKLRDAGKQKEPGTKK